MDRFRLDRAMKFVVQLIVFLGIIGSIISVWKGLGGWGLPVALILAAIAAFYCLIDVRAFQPLISMTKDGGWLAQSIAHCKLTDFTYRGHSKKRNLAPISIFDRAKKEFVMLAITAHATFEFHVENIDRALKQGGVDLYFIVVKPGLPELLEISKIENFNLSERVKDTIDIAANEGFFEYPKFHFKTIDYVPPFTGSLVDGNIQAADGKSADDANAFMRIQPRTAFGSQHFGYIFEVEKPSGKSQSEVIRAFENYANDFREAWRRGEDARPLRQVSTPA